MSTDHGSKLRIVDNREDVISVLELEGVVFTEIGLTLPDKNFPFHHWEALVVGLRRIRQGVQWAIGDALNYGERMYGEMYAQAIEITGYSYSTLSNMKWVAAVWPMEYRRPGLDFSHHKACASLFVANREAAMEVMDRAQEEGLSEREVAFDAKEAMDDLGIEAPPPPTGLGLRTLTKRTATEIQEEEEDGGEDYGYGAEIVEGEYSEQDDGYTPSVQVHVQLQQKAEQSSIKLLRTAEGNLMESLLGIVVRLASTERESEWATLHEEARTLVREYGLENEAVESSLHNSPD